MKKSRLARIVATLAFSGAGLVAVFPAGGSATAPAAGVNCQSDGKISGRGATFQTLAQTTFSNGFTADVCGPVVSANGNPTPNMVIYNTYTTLTGSGAGQTATICRTDAFGGTDIPYDNATKAFFDAAPGTGRTAAQCNPAGFTPPFTPTGAFPNAGDVAAPIMSFPVAGSSIVVGANFGTAAAPLCTPRPATLQLTGAMVSDLFQGDITNWNDARLRAGGVNPSLATCNLTVRRVVRLDRSGTTQIQKNYLKNVDGASTPTCNGLAANTWSTLALDANNIVWPTGGTCTVLTTANGNAGVVAACADVAAQPGAVCYGDLADMSQPVAAQLNKATLRNGANTAFINSIVGTRANCNFGSVVTPGTGPAGAVGLDPGDTWAFDNAAGNRSDVTNQGVGYPICGLTFDLVYSGLNDGSVPNAIGGLNANQRRTLYSYMSYILSSAGQDRLTTARYQSLGTSLTATLRTGFQAGF